jgi:hypothetical protein
MVSWASAISPSGDPRKVVGVLGRVGEHQRHGIGLADVLGGGANQPTGHEQRVLAAGQHSREPIERRVRVRAADRLMQGRNEVVVLLAVLVVGGAAFLQHLAQLLGRQELGGSDVEQGLRQRQQVAAVAVGERGQRRAGLGLQRQVPPLEGLGFFQEGFERHVVQALQHEDLAAR